MSQVMLTGWRPGLRKVALTKLLQQRAGLGLHAAKDYTDRLLAGEQVRVEIPLLAAAELLAREADALGVEAQVEAVPQHR